MWAQFFRTGTIACGTTSIYQLTNVLLTNIGAMEDLLLTGDLQSSTVRSGMTLQDIPLTTGLNKSMGVMLGILAARFFAGNSRNKMLGAVMGAMFNIGLESFLEYVGCAPAYATTTAALVGTFLLLGFYLITQINHKDYRTLPFIHRKFQG